MAWNEAWPHLTITNLTRSLTSLEKVVASNDASRSDEVSAALARFLVVRTCGYLEQVVEECCKAYLKSKSCPRSSSFGSSWFGVGRNPSSVKLIDLTKRFDATWADQLETMLKADDEKLQRELAFLVDRRNVISHGLNEGIGTRKALSLVAPAKEIANWFIKTFDPR